MLFSVIVPLFFFISIFFQKDVFSQDMKREAEARLLEKDHLIQKFKAEILETKQHITPSVKRHMTHLQQEASCSVKRPCLQQEESREEREGKEEQNTKASSLAPKIVVFVSFSMPKQTLTALFKTLPFHKNVRVVIRGLIQESMQKTAEILKELEGMVDVDPKVFKDCQIERVPAFVLYDKERPKAKLQGNVTIDFAKSVFQKKGLM